MIRLLLIALGGAIGTLARYLVYQLVHIKFHGSQVVGTLLVNLIGCFVLGLVSSQLKRHALITPNINFFVTMGVLGAFTTFSTYSYETSELFHGRAYFLATGNILANVALGLLAIEAGRSVSRFFP